MAEEKDCAIKQNMCSYKDIFREKESQNWFKASLALKIVKDGLHDFLSDDIRQLQQTILNSVLQTNSLPQDTVCNQCKTQNVLPCPTKDICTRGRNCKYHDGISNQPKVCPNGICQGVRDGIKAAHRYNNPSWKNTNSQLWSSNYWTIGKCFLPPDGYTLVTSTEETDFNGILSILMNCVNFQQKLSIDVTQTPNVLTDAREIGRAVRHSHDLKVSDADLTSYFCTLTTLLGYPICLTSDRRAAEALATLNQLAADKLVITDSDVSDVISEARRRIENAQSEIAKQQGDCLAMIEDAKSKVMAAIDSQMNRLTESKTVHYDVIKKEFKEDIMAYYLEEHDALSMFPLVPEADANINKLYVPPLIYRVERGSNDSNSEVSRRNQNKGIPVVAYNEILCSSVNPSKNIYVTGMAGMGKTSLCKRITTSWCDTNQDLSEKCLPKKANAENESKSESRFCDIHTLSKFQFVFYISLRDSHDTHDIDDMIMEQIVRELSRSSNYDCKFLEHVLQTENCLVLLDGLDEFSHTDCKRCRKPNSQIPHRKSRGNCTIVTTSRHWKIDDIRLKDSQIDQEFEIAGFEDSSSIHIIRNVIQCINKRYQTKMESEEFINNILNEYKDKFPDLISIPIVLMQMLSLWCDGKALGKSKCQIYSNMVEMLLYKGKQRSPETITRTMQSNSELNTNEIPACLTHKPNIRDQWSFIRALGQLAFHTLFPENNERSLLVFGSEEADKYLNPEQLAAALEAGFLSRSRHHTFSERQSTFSYLHKTYQEFFCAIHLACDMSAVDITCSRISLTGLQMHDIYNFNYYTRDRPLTNLTDDLSVVYTFLNGMNVSTSQTLSESILNAIRDIVLCMDSRMNRYFQLRSVFDSVQSFFQSAEVERLANTKTCSDGASHCLKLAFVNPLNVRGNIQPLHQSTSKQHLQMLHIFGGLSDVPHDMIVDILHSSHQSLECLILHAISNIVIKDVPLLPNITVLHINTKRDYGSLNKFDCIDLSQSTKLISLLLEHISTSKIIVPVNRLKTCCISNLGLTEIEVKMIGKFQYLSQLSLSDVSITQPIEMADCTQLTVLDLFCVDHTLAVNYTFPFQRISHHSDNLDVIMPTCVSLETCKLTYISEQAATRVCESLSNAIKLKTLSLKNITVTCNIDITRCNRLSSLELERVQAPQILLNASNLTKCTIRVVSRNVLTDTLNAIARDAENQTEFTVRLDDYSVVTQQINKSFASMKRLNTLMLHNCVSDVLIPDSVQKLTFSGATTDTLSHGLYSNMSLPLIPNNVEKLEFRGMDVKVSFPVIPGSVRELKISGTKKPWSTVSCSNMSLPLIPDSVEKLEFRDMDVKDIFPVIPDNVRQITLLDVYMSPVTLRQLVKRTSEMPSLVQCDITLGNVVSSEEFKCIKQEVTSSKYLNVIRDNRLKFVFKSIK